MGDDAVLDASQLFAETPEGILADTGMPRHRRRITDKILAAFNQAYAMGETEIARQLWDCLAAAERVNQDKRRRRSNQTLNLASHWVAFVDARENFRRLSRGSPRNAAETSAAFRAMIDVHERWRALNHFDNPSPLRPTAAAAVSRTSSFASRDGGASLHAASARWR